MDNLENIKSAIEREHIEAAEMKRAAQDWHARVLAASAEHDATKAKLACLEAVYVAQSERVAEAEQRAEELERDLEEANLTIGNMQAAIGKLKDSEQSAITMRPISELPDKVPDGCLIIAWDDAEGTFVWEEHRDDIQFIAKKCPMHGFYILPKPKPKRKLKPCPWCGAMPLQQNRGHWIINHTKDCAIEGTSIISKNREHLWGWE